MIGAIIGDTVGSRFEFFNTNTKTLPNGLTILP